MTQRCRTIGFLLFTVVLSGCGTATAIPSVTWSEAPSSPPTTAPPTLTPTKPPTPTRTPVPPTATATVGPATATPPGQPCEIVALRDVTVFSRPSRDASVFGTMSADMRVVAEGRTPDGWIGFEPGVAQAANVGIFRLRWVKESEGIRLEGACDQLPQLEGPPAGVCFTMPMGETQVYSEPHADSEVVTTLDVGAYAAVTERAGDWAKVDLSVGNTGLERAGWVRAQTLNLNGPCDDLSVVEP